MVDGLVMARRLQGAVRGRVVEDEHLGLERHRGPFPLDRVEALDQQVAPGRADDGVGDLDQRRISIQRPGSSGLKPSGW